MGFPCVECRSGSTGRFAVVRGTRLAVWQVALLARTLGWGGGLARHLAVLPEAIGSAKGYYRRHTAEVEALIEGKRAYETPEGLGKAQTRPAACRLSAVGCR